MNKEQSAQLRKPFKDDEVGTFQKRWQDRSGVWRESPPVPSISGHTVIQRLLDVDPDWSWRIVSPAEGIPPIEYDSEGRPIRMWIELTVCGVGRLGCGSIDPRASYGDPYKSLFQDALKFTARLFGVGLYLRAKGGLSEGEDIVEDEEIAEPNEASASQQPQVDVAKPQPKPEPERPQARIAKQPQPKPERPKSNGSKDDATSRIDRAIEHLLTQTAAEVGETFAFQVGALYRVTDWHELPHEEKVRLCNLLLAKGFWDLYEQWLDLSGDAARDVQTNILGGKHILELTREQFEDLAAQLRGALQVTA